MSYKDTLGGVKLDPMPGVSTGTWRDTRFSPPLANGGRPENGLTGNILTVNAGTSAISVPASMASLRFWRNASVAGLTSGVATLVTDTLGYEWDENLDNASWPTEKNAFRLRAPTRSAARRSVSTPLMYLTS